MEKEDKNPKVMSSFFPVEEEDGMAPKWKAWSIAVVSLACKLVYILDAKETMS